MNFRQCCKQYYANQAMTGNGLAVYSPQIGHGIFSNLAKGIIPFLKTTVAPKLIKGAAGFATDLLAGENVMDSVKKRGANLVKSTFDDVLGRSGNHNPRGYRKRRAVVRASGSVKRRKRSKKRRKNISLISRDAF